MLTVDDAVARILADVPRAPAETVPLAEAFGRVLAEDLDADVDVPPFANSAMDGYAVRAADLAGAPRSLRIVGVIAAGMPPEPAIGPGEAVAIMTGAPVPPGADAVVMVEDTDRSMAGAVEIRVQAAVHQHVRDAGSDIRRGTRLLTRGDRLGPASVGLVASIGRPTVAVARRPVVAILTTGDEVVPAGNPLRPGQIWSSNNIALVGAALEAGAVPRDHGIVADDLEATVAALEAALEAADALVTTGGVSVGEFDFVKEAHARIGAKVDFWKVAMKPGKPLAFGRVERGGRSIPLFGLPGNPVSCLVNFAQFVRPWIRTSLGDPRPFLPVIDAVALEDLQEAPGRARLHRVRLERHGAGFGARNAGSQSSGALTGFARSHGLLLVAATDRGPRAGEPCRVQLLDGGFLAGEAPEYGW